METKKRELKHGDVVYLNSDEVQKMTIETIENDCASCVWFYHMGLFHWIGHNCFQLLLTNYRLFDRPNNPLENYLTIHCEFLNFLSSDFNYLIKFSSAISLILLS